MTQQTNEMSINLPMVSISPEDSMAAADPMGTTPQMDAPYPADDSVVMGNPNNSRHPSCISVYAETISPSGSYDPECEVCTFDVVFNVGIREGEISKTYRVVKRIGVDKVKLACDAECSSPVSIVEEKAQEKKAASAAQAKRFRVLAGLE